MLEYNQSSIDQFNEKIKYDYKVHWIVDNLPAATILQYRYGEQNQTFYDSGFLLRIKGCDNKGSVSQDCVNYIHNHINIKLLFHRNPISYDGLRIVGFEVDPQR